MAAPSPFPGEQIEVASTRSTSDLARALIVEGRTCPFVVRALEQTAGRGRGSNRWWSDAGSLMFTSAFDPREFGLDPAREILVALTAATAIVDAIARFLPTPGALIRWPNDVEYRGRKLAGLLPERVKTPGGPRFLLGVGLNVATDFDGAPQDVRALATSLTSERPAESEPIGPSDLFDPILAAIGAALAHLGADDPTLPARWNALDALRGLRVRVVQGDRTIEGEGAGIAPDGGLRIDTVAGVVSAYGGIVPRNCGGI